jgi:hypothetical protein
MEKKNVQLSFSSPSVCTVLFYCDHELNPEGRQPLGSTVDGLIRRSLEAPFEIF